MTPHYAPPTAKAISSGALPLGGEVALDVQVDGVVVRLDAKHVRTQLLAGGLLAFDVVNGDFHDLRFRLADDDSGAFVSRDGTLHDEESLLGHDFEHFEVFDGHTSVTGLACHAHALEDTCRRRGRTN